jgi:excisionase family DNA binding protein
LSLPIFDGNSTPHVTTIKRRIEIVAFEGERIIQQPASGHCPVCQGRSEWLTTRQAARMMQVQAQSIRRWLAQGGVHALKTPGGQHRICRNSLLARMS